MKDNQKNREPISNISIQTKIEAAMQKIGEGVRWESVFLFSSEGLLMARSGMSEDYCEENLLEFSFSLSGLVKLLKDDLPINEIIVRGIHHKQLVFRYFQAWDHQMIIAAVVSGKRGYRRALGKLMKTIQHCH